MSRYPSTHDLLHHLTVPLSGVATSFERVRRWPPRSATAVAESFWHTLKNELIHRHQFETRDEAQCVISEYIEVFYN